MSGGSSSPKPSSAERAQSQIETDQYARYEDFFSPIEAELTQSDQFDTGLQLSQALTSYGAGSPVYEDQLAKQQGMEQRYLSGFGLPNQAPGVIGEAQDRQRSVLMAAAETGLNQALRRGVPDLIRSRRGTVTALGQGMPGAIQSGLSSGINLATTNRAIQSQQQGMYGAALGALGAGAAFGQGAGWIGSNPSVQGTGINPALG